LGLNFTVGGQPPVKPEDTASANFRLVSPGYLQAMGIPLKRGRDFNDHDRRDSTPVALINETLAKHYFANEDPIGKQLNIEGQQAPREIVGIIGDVKQIKLDAEGKSEIYVPFFQIAVPAMNIVVRTTTDPGSMTSAVLQQISRVDPDQPVYQVKTMDEYLGESMAQRRLSTVLLGVFAALALNSGGARGLWNDELSGEPADTRNWSSYGFGSQATGHSQAGGETWDVA
jgi:hypothetical protein